MEQDSAAAASSTRRQLPTRRELREAERGAAAGRRPQRQATKSGGQAASLVTAHRWVPRAAVLSTLAVATIAMPLQAGAINGESIAPPEPEAVPNGLTAYDVVMGNSALPALSPYLASVPRDMGRVEAASRSADRDPLPGCDPAVRPKGTNGNLDTHALCALPEPGEYLRPDAAVAFAAMNDAFRANFGRNICVSDSYRTYSAQVWSKRQHGFFAAPPGESMHGWGLAVDLCSMETGDSKVYAWLNANGPIFGWANPKWAKRGDIGPYEPWHFEYTKGVKEVGAYYG